MAGSRVVSLWLTFAAILMGGAGWTPDAGVLRAAAESLTLNLRLTAADNLPPSSKRVLIAEAQAIWRQEGIRLQWLAGAEARAGETLRVLVMPNTVGAPPDGEPWPVGELLRFEDSRAIAIASIGGALRVVDESQRFQLLELPMLRDYRLGLVLGRAVAHEIGHFLLQSNTHSASGLMRARIGAQEFADPSRNSFQLDPATQLQLSRSRAQVEVP
jgi:hypothetical protein